MSRIELILKTIGVSTVVLSSCITPATAQTLYKPPKNHDSHTFSSTTPPQQLHSNLLSTKYQSELEPEQPRISSQQEINNSINTFSSPEISQATEAEQPLETTQETETEQPPEPTQETETDTYSEFQKLEQDPNRLKRPSAPEEVKIDLNQPLTLKQALELSLRNNKDLEQARLTFVRRQRELQQAQSAWYPDLSVQANYQNSNSAASQRANDRLRQQGVSGAIIDDGSENQFDGTLGLNFDVYTGGERGADIRRARKELDLSRLNVDQLTEQSLFEAARDYYALQDANAQVEIALATVEDAQQTLKDAQLLEQAGLGTRFDVLSAEVELADADQALTTSRANQSIARRQLAETLSLGQQINLDTADEIEEAGIWQQSLEETIILGYDNRVELDQLLARRDSNEEQRKIALAAIRPNLSLFANYEFLEILDDQANLTDGYAVGARLQWIFFDGGTALARARQEETDILIDQTDFANQRNQIRIEIEQAYFSLQSNKENIVTSEKAVEQAEESLRLARLRFQAGVGTQTDVIDSQSRLTTARGNRLSAIIDYNQSLNQLYRATNGLATLYQTLN